MKKSIANWKKGCTFAPERGEEKPRRERGEAPQTPKRGEGSKTGLFDRLQKGLSLDDCKHREGAILEGYNWQGLQPLKIRV